MDTNMYTWTRFLSDLVVAIKISVRWRWHDRYDNIAADNVATIVQEIIVIVNLTDGRACGVQANRFLCQPGAVPKWLYVTISDHS